MLHWLVRVLRWPFGYRFAPENHVRPVFRWRQFNRWGRGSFWINPLERTPPVLIYTGLQVGDFFFDQVMSQDNIPFKFHIIVNYAFQPHEQASSREMAAQLIGSSQEKAHSLPIFEWDSPLRDQSKQTPRTDFASKLKAFVKDHTCEKLYSLATEYRAEELCSEAARLVIKRRLAQHLRVRLHDLGIVLIGDGVLIREIGTHPKFTGTMLHVEEHEVVLRTLGEYVEQHQELLPLLQQYKEALSLIDETVKAEYLNSLEDHPEKLVLRSILDPEYLDNGGSYQRRGFIAGESREALESPGDGYRDTSATSRKAKANRHKRPRRR